VLAFTHYSAIAVTLLVALLHVYFLVLEMFLWRTPKGLKTFKMTPEKAEVTASLAMNQGLYNGFLAAGLVWSLGLPEPLDRTVRSFFLICVVVAGVFGAATASKKILYIQAMPGLLALCLTQVS
jgi:putative membrane protein